MDKIQKQLIKLGRKDLADEYYQKIAISKNSNWVDIKYEFESTQLHRWEVDEPDKDKASKLVLKFAKEAIAKKDTLALRKKYKIVSGPHQAANEPSFGRQPVKYKKVTIDHIAH